MAELFERSLQQLLSAIAADQPTPACGAASAMAGATGLALIAKALAVSAAHAEDPRLQALLNEAHALFTPFSDYAADDGQAFRRLLEATAHSDEQATASRQACAIPLAIAHTCLQALGLAVRAWPMTRPALRSDLSAGAQLLHGALSAALSAVDADLSSLPSSAMRDSASRHQRRLAQRARARLRHLRRLARH